MSYVVCPYCNWEGALKDWSTDYCKDCGNEVGWDEVGNDPVPTWESKNYEHVWYGPQLKPEKCPPEKEHHYDVHKFTKWLNQEWQHLNMKYDYASHIPTPQEAGWWEAIKEVCKMYENLTKQK